ncbi:MAG: carbonic anhydrase [Bacteroidetes bacterium]|nr:carbonic anhydrase [Bacteroidota bacterium]
MGHHTRYVLRRILCLFAVSALLFAGENEGVDGRSALTLLKDGNKRFTANQLKPKDYSAERHQQIKGQQPYAIILTCSDSRVSPEILFDESLGRLFVIRVAGNVIDPVIAGSIEYAAEHLHAKLLLVLGHSSCGAVTATVHGGEFPPNIATIADRIRPAVEKARKAEKNADALLGKAVSENVNEQVASALRSSSILKEMIEKKEFTIAGAVYDINNGEVSFFK